jgi:cholesterol oxidase
MPANPGVNPSLTITALAEYAMSLVPEQRRTDGQANGRTVGQADSRTVGRPIG